MMWWEPEDCFSGNHWVGCFFLGVLTRLLFSRRGVSRNAPLSPPAPESSARTCVARGPRPLTKRCVCSCPPLSVSLYLCVCLYLPLSVSVSLSPTPSCPCSGVVFVPSFSRLCPILALLSLFRSCHCPVIFPSFSRHCPVIFPSLSRPRPLF